MSGFDVAAAEMDDVLFDEFGEDASVQRGTDAAVPVRVAVVRGVQKLGEFGQVIDRVTTVSFRNSQWVPQPKDVLTYSSGTRKVASIESDDGFVTMVVLHG